MTLMTSPAICSLDECDKPVHSRGYCYGHYMKAWRYGTPTPQHAQRWKDMTGQRVGALVVVERYGKQWLCQCDCGATTLARIGDLNRKSVRSCGNMAIHRRRDDIEYCTAHDRVEQDRGLARQQTCVDCGRSAEHWSYNHDDPDQRLTTKVWRWPVAYSVKPEHYSPRCVKCHYHFDRNRRDSHPVSV